MTILSGFVRVCVLIAITLYFLTQGTLVWPLLLACVAGVLLEFLRWTE